MQLRRARLLFSPTRLHACKNLFRHPWKSMLDLAFLNHRPIHLTLGSGQSLTFSRGGRDHLFWDWYLKNGGHPIEFTPAGEILLRYQSWNLLLRPGTTDFFIFREIFLKDEYGLKNLPDTLDTVVDLGGNVGLFTCALLPRAKRVITVEPVQGNYQQAAKNITHNGGDPGNLLRFAMTAKSGQEITIHLSGRNTGMNSMYAGWVEQGGVVGQEKVPTLSLADLLARTDCGQVDLLKCDIEGAEFEVFQATPISTLRQIRRILMEVHVNTDHPRTALDVLTSHLNRAGFALTCDNLGNRRGTETWFLKAHLKPAPIFACRG